MLLSTIAANIIPFVPSLINLAEGLIRKPKAGADKKDAVIQSLRTMLGKLAAVNGVTTEGITDDQLSGLVETVFQNMKSGFNTNPEDKIYILTGQVREVLPLTK